MSKSVKQGSLTIALLPSLVVYALAVVLVVLTRENPGSTVQYWELLVPLIALYSLISGWGTAYARNQSRFFYLIKQAIHWGLVLGLLWLLQTQGISAALGDQKYTLVLLYVVGLAMVFAGLYLDLKQILYGAFLGLSAYLLTAPANIAILKPIGETLRISDATNKPLTMIVILALVAFAVSAVLLMVTRGAIMARRSR